MMVISAPQANTIADAIALVSAVGDPAKARQALQKISDGHAALEKGRAELAADRAAFEKERTAERAALGELRAVLDQRAAEVSAQAQAAAAEAQKYQKFRAEMLRKSPSELLALLPRPAA